MEQMCFRITLLLCTFKHYVMEIIFIYLRITKKVSASPSREKHPGDKCVTALISLLRSSPVLPVQPVFISVRYSGEGLFLSLLLFLLLLFGECSFEVLDHPVFFFFGAVRQCSLLENKIFEEIRISIIESQTHRKLHISSTTHHKHSVSRMHFKVIFKKVVIFLNKLRCATQNMTFGHLYRLNNTAHHPPQRWHGTTAL